MNAASAAHPPVDAESKADPVRMDFPVDSPGGPPPATANRFTGAPCTPPAHHPHTTPHTKATRSYACLRRETEEGRAEDGLDFRVIRMPPHSKKHPHTSPQFWICGGSERRLPGPDQEGSITTRPKELRLHRPAVDWVIVVCTAAALIGLQAC